jgi:hypothetical protein
MREKLVAAGWADNLKKPAPSAISRRRFGGWAPLRSYVAF